MKRLSKDLYEKKSRPIKVLQFGEGNFLRAFVDWFFSELNAKSDFNGNVCVVQPIKNGRVDSLEQQDGLYTLLLEGIENGQLINNSEIIDVIEKCINPYEDFESYMEMAKLPSLEFIVSNTTEAGIVYEAVDPIDGVCPDNFPAKLLMFLKARYTHFSASKESGLYILPCELIDFNAAALKEILNKLAADWKMDADFIKWMNEANTFCSTLVDRIVPGYPKETIKEITKKNGYVDDNVVKGEVFHLWVIENKGGIKEALGLDDLGYNVKFVDDLTPFKQQKVRVLNGAHTAMVPVSYLYGIDTVGESVTDELIKAFVEKVIYEEVIPATTHILSDETLRDFAASVFERFENPTIRHELLSISLNSTTKYKTRLLPSVKDYIDKTNKLPKGMLLSLAATLVFFRGKRGEETYSTHDNETFLKMYDTLWASYDGSKESVDVMVDAYLGLTEHWAYNFDLVKDLKAFVSEMVYTIVMDSMEVAIKKVINE